MGFTAIEKVLARASRQAQARAGDIVYPDPDMIMVHDGLVQQSKQVLDRIGIAQLASRKKVMMVSDHDVIYGSARAAERGAFNRKAAQAWGVEQFFDVGQGGHGHIFPMEEGRVLPGMFYFDNDTHATNAGAVGAFGLRVGTEISRVLATGTTWVKVPETVRIELKGRLPAQVQGRDIGFYLARKVKSGQLPVQMDYRVIEYSGDLNQFGLGARVALCSSPTEMRAAAVFLPPSEAILAYCEQHAKREFTPIFSDPDAHYEACGSLELALIEPQVVLPGGVGNSVDVGEVAGTAIDHAFIGSCGSGMYDDLLSAASVLKGRRVAPGVRLFIVPGSQRSLRRMTDEGVTKIFLDAGAMLLPPGCGPCNDAVVGPLATGEVSISTATNSNTGRFGARDAKLFLGSPLTVAASAVAGTIIDPRQVPADQALYDQMEAAYA
ncbi:aconitase family protein [Paraburkholderia xenovorans]|uniref:3-isopropylmalate dehydratase large subunit n=1 Tax=Paraburkholderia xenovorans TaxID=36873 RepID=UPI0038BBC0B6